MLDDLSDQPQRCTLRSAGRLDTLLRWAPGTWLEGLSFKKAEMIWKSQGYDIRYDMQFCAECHPMFVACFTRPKFFRSVIINWNITVWWWLPYIVVFEATPSIVFRVFVDAGWRLKPPFLAGLLTASCSPCDWSSSYHSCQWLQQLQTARPKDHKSAK